MEPAAMYIPTASDAPDVSSLAIFAPFESVVTIVPGAVAGATGGSGMASPGTGWSMGGIAGPAAPPKMADIRLGFACAVVSAGSDMRAAEDVLTPRAATRRALESPIVCVEWRLRAAPLGCVRRRGRKRRKRVPRTREEVAECGRAVRSGAASGRRGDGRALDASPIGRAQRSQSGTARDWPAPRLRRIRSEKIFSMHNGETTSREPETKTLVVVHARSSREGVSTSESFSSAFQLSAHPRAPATRSTHAPPRPKREHGRLLDVREPAQGPARQGGRQG